MIEPLNESEQMREMTFKPDRILAVLFGTSKFDAVFKKQNNGEFK